MVIPVLKRNPGDARNRELLHRPKLLVRALKSNPSHHPGVPRELA